MERQARMAYKKREVRRFNLWLPARHIDASSRSWQPCLVVNAGFHGMAIHIPEGQLKPQTDVVVRLELGPHTFNLNGRTAWTEPLAAARTCSCTAGISYDATVPFRTRMLVLNHLRWNSATAPTDSLSRCASEG